MSNDLRDLDAKFAEVVLGWTYHTYPDGACPDIKHWVDADGNIKTHRHFNFHLSLDAAWAGVGKHNVMFFPQKVGGVLCWIDSEYPCKGATPAEALVRALIADKEAQRGE